MSQHEMVAQSAGDATATPHRSWVLAALVLCMALVAVDTTIVATAVPQIVQDLGGFSQFSWVFSIYLLAQTVTIPVYGKLADLFGRKPVLVLGILLFLAGSALCASAWSMTALIVFRGVQGLGAGAIAATVNTLAGDLYSLAERGKAQGWLSSVWGISAIAGPALGGGFVEYLSWRWIFLVNVPIGIAALGLLLRYLHERVERRQHKIDYLGAALVTLGAGSLYFGLLQGGVAWPWFSAPSVAIFAASAVFAALAVRVELRAAEPIMPPWVWRHRALIGANLATVGLGLLTIGLTTFVPTYAQSLLGLGPIGAGLLLASMGIAWPLAATFSNRLYLRIGFRNTALVGSAAELVGAGLFATVPFTGTVWQLVLAAMFVGAGNGLLSTSMLVAVQSTVDWARRGVITGASMFARYLGQSAGAVVFGVVANVTLGARLAAAPADLAGALPRDVNGVSKALVPGAQPPGPALDYLQRALYASIHHVFVGLLVAVVLMIVILLTLTPRRFPTDNPDQNFR